MIKNIVYILFVLYVLYIFYISTIYNNMCVYDIYQVCLVSSTPSAELGTQ